MMVYGSGIGDRHNHDDLPIRFLGKSGGTLPTGRLYLALFDRMGALPTA